MIYSDDNIDDVYNSINGKCKLTDFQAFSNVRMGKAIRKLAEEDERIGLPTNNMKKEYTLPPAKYKP